MSSSRANLVTVPRPRDGLATARQPLAQRPQPKPDPPDEDEEEAAIWTMRATPRAERMISFTMRLPLGMMEEVERVCAQQGLDKSAFGRDAFAAHLRKSQK